MKKENTYSLISLIVLVVIFLSGFLAYRWQHNKVVGLNNKVSNLNSQIIGLNNQVSTQKEIINKGCLSQIPANTTAILSLSQSVVGSTSTTLLNGADLIYFIHI